MGLEEALDYGIWFDGSSIEGFVRIVESDMYLVPDLTTYARVPWNEHGVATARMICDIYTPDGKRFAGDPRYVLANVMHQAAELGYNYKVGPELEFFLFKPEQNGRVLPIPQDSAGYFDISTDYAAHVRHEMTRALRGLGIAVEASHHEVAPGQHEIDLSYGDAVHTADHLVTARVAIKAIAQQHGLYATFMPKPIYGDNGSGMHTHQSIWKEGGPTFAGSLYADLSETALFYIGGIIKHARALNAFTNPTTNSYKRLVPGYEAPVLLAYSGRNRSAACRIPHGNSPKSKRVEVRFPDPTANPYLAFSAMLMAGLDGIRNKIHPGDAMDKNLYDLPPEELKDVPHVAGSLREALTALQDDYEFLLQGDVFTKDQIDGYLELKWEEVTTFETAPHPIEFHMYYSV